MAISSRRLLQCTHTCGSLFLHGRSEQCALRRRRLRLGLLRCRFCIMQCGMPANRLSRTGGMSNTSIVARSARGAEAAADTKSDDDDAARHARRNWVVQRLLACVCNESRVNASIWPMTYVQGLLQCTLTCGSLFLHSRSEQCALRPRRLRLGLLRRRSCIMQCRRPANRLSRKVVMHIPTTP